VLFQLYRTVLICNDNVPVHMRIWVIVACGRGKSLKRVLFYLWKLVWCSNSLGELLSCLWVWSGGFAARRVKAGTVLRPGVVDLRGCGGESCLVYSRSTEV
jgi:hypothetical protein